MDTKQKQCINESLHKKPHFVFLLSQKKERW